MIHSKKEDNEFDFKFPINQSDVYHHTFLSSHLDPRLDLWERAFPIRLVSPEKGEFNPLGSLLLSFCSQVYNTFLQKPLIDTFQREQANKETSRLYSEVGEVAVDIKIPSHGILNVYRKDLNTRVIWSSYKKNDFVVCSIPARDFILNWVYWWYVLSTMWDRNQKVDFGDGYGDLFIDNFNLSLKNNFELTTSFFDWTARTSINRCVAYSWKFMNIWEEILSKKFFFDGINEGVTQNKPFFIWTPQELSDFQLQNYGHQVREHLAHFNTPGSPKIYRFFKNTGLQDLGDPSQEPNQFIHIFLDWDHNYPGKKLVNSFPDFCFSVWMINNRKRTPFDVIHFDSSFF